MASRTFEQWVTGTFDHDVEDPAWHWAADADHCVEEDGTNVEYLRHLFTHSDRVLADFTNAQVDQGLNFIAFPACSDHSYCLTYGNATWPKRRDCIHSVYDLYVKCFVARCSEDLGHLNQIENPLNHICYMWWDLIGGDHTKVEEAVEYIAVLEQCLTLSHQACLEGALHGLGHWQLYYPQRVEQIIDAFLRERSGLRPELVAYAGRARNGNIA